MQLETLSELAHYVRSIPFIETPNKEIWVAPDFLLRIRRGSYWDHAVLMACLFLSCEKEEFDEKKEEEKNQKNNDKKKNKKTDGVKTNSNTADEIPLENRVYVCIGTKVNTYEITAWVMVFNKNLDSVVFWDVHEHK
jgi:hypothetical protein